VTLVLVVLGSTLSKTTTSGLKHNMTIPEQRTICCPASLVLTARSKTQQVYRMTQLVHLAMPLIKGSAKVDNGDRSYEDHASFPDACYCAQGYFWDGISACKACSVNGTASSTLADSYGGYSSTWLEACNPLQNNSIFESLAGCSGASCSSSAKPVTAVSVASIALLFAALCSALLQ